jgi:hypothetical protein
VKSLLGEHDVNSHLEQQVSDFRQHIKHYQESLNNEGVWLFLAALGCWGVPSKEMQNAAFVITIIIFFYRLYLQLEDKRSFKKIAIDIESEINNSDIPEDTKKARLYDLNKLVKKELSFFKTLRSSIVFLICYVFTIFSMEVAKSM